ncbi:hypothetical protein EJ08DRAFT_696859 [Tothia fuscella]|uniref:Uncharacterized protein n=1 Tax=Tothia fuscella TaxID=1048955 RepID=A0A9P4TZ17_9PEZI|nr:hypothetical protein EJ08DRAFT_696859 [Tothia fuscella]
MLTRRNIRSVSRRSPKLTRNCGSWGRNRRAQNDKQDVESGKEAGQPRDRQSWVNTSSRNAAIRENYWNEHLKEVKRMLEEDPYERLFGRSNRRLRGLETKGWPFDVEWWDKETRAFGSRILSSQERFATTQDRKTDAPERDIQQSSTAQHSSMGETSLEHDPISNRMVPKGDHAFSHYGQDLDAAVDIPVKPYRPAGPVRNEAEKSEEAFETPVEPSRPAERVSKEPKRTPSFTMLKEEPSESEPAPSEASVTTPPPALDVRAEYHQYKARRLPDSITSSVPWLEQEGFGSPPSTHTLSDTSKAQKLGHKPVDKRRKLEKDFEIVHSAEKELAQARLSDVKPWKMQKSNGTSIPSPETAPEPTVETVTEQAAAMAERIPPKIIHETKHDSTALRSILEYNLDVAAHNLETAERKATIARMDRFLHGVPILEPLWKKVSSEITKGDNMSPEKKSNELETSLQRHTDNLIKAPSVLQTALQRHNKSAVELAQSVPKETSMETTRVHDPVGYDHARESRKNIDKYQGSSFLSSIHESPVLPSPTTQDADTAKSEERKPIPAEDADLSTYYATKASTEERIAHIKKQLQKHAPPRASFAEKVPSLAEMFGYNNGKKSVSEEKKKLQNRSEVQMEEMNTTLDTARDRFKSVAEQFDMTHGADKEPIIQVQTEETNTENEKVSQVTEQILEIRKSPEESQSQLRELSKTIRDIYEESYGPITTKHSQVSVPAVEATTVEPPVPIKIVEAEKVEAKADLIEARANQVQTKTQPVITPEPSIPAATSVEEPTPTAVIEQTQESPVVEPIKEEMVTYTVLAYDPQTHRVTQQILTSKPEQENDEIPLTIALKGLDEPAKFLPYLKGGDFTIVSADRNLLMLVHGKGGGGPSPLPVETAEEVQPRASREQTTRPDATNIWKAIQVNRTIPNRTPNPRRLEPVFSGREHWSKQHRKDRKQWRRRFRRVLKTVGLLGVGAAGTIYVAGAMDEMKKVVVTDDGGREYVRRRS